MHVLSSPFGIAAALTAAAGLAGFAVRMQTEAGAAQARTTLQPASAFASVPDPHARSLALFTEMTKVIETPRCMNCHPAARRPGQGDDRHPHLPMVFAGASGHGLPGLPCSACHHASNTPIVGARLKSVPGSPKWGLAPTSMAWEGMSPSEICRQLKDKSRNGGRDLEAIYRHMAFDDLVGWAWNPGAGRASAPGSQKAFGELVRAWIDTGAACPG